MWTNSTGWQDKIPGFGDYSKKIDYSPIGTFKSGSLDFSKAFGFSAGGKVPNNLKPFFIGGIFKGIKKAFSGVVKAVSSVVSGVGNFLNSPLGSILTTAISFVPGFQWVAPVIAGFKAASAIAQGDIMGAITNTVGALSGFFPETMGNFFSWSYRHIRGWSWWCCQWIPQRRYWWSTWWYWWNAWTWSSKILRWHWRLY